MKESIYKGEIPFTMTSNELLNSPLISLKAKGLYSYMFGKPNNWKFTIKSMSNQLLEGRDAIASGLEELRKSGWVSYSKKHDGSGEYYLRTKPNTENPIEVLEPKQENPNKENPIQGKPVRINKKEFNNNKDSNNKEPELFSELNNQKNKKAKKEAKPLVNRFFVSVEENEVPQDLKDGYLKAKAFFDLFSKNLKDAGSVTTQLEKSKFKAFVDPIRLMVERDNITDEQFRKLFVFLQSSDFWKKNILSTNKLRVQTPKLLIQANQNQNGGQGKNFKDQSIANSGAATGARNLSVEYLQRISQELGED